MADDSDVLARPATAATTAPSTTLPEGWDWNYTDVNLADQLAYVAQNGWDTIRVGHIDTGIYPNDYLGSWILFDEGLNLMEPGHPATPPAEPIPSSGLTMFSHGTRTSSVFSGFPSTSAVTNFHGAAPQIPVIPVRANNDVILNRMEEQDRVGEGILHAIDKGCSVISISFGMPAITRNRTLGQAVDAAYEKGVIICGAGGQYAGGACYPGKFFRAICVGGYKQGDAGARPLYFDYTQTTGFIDVWGPAKPITRCTADTANDQTLATGDGTSYATPVTASAAAYWLRLRGEEIAAKYADAPWKKVEAFRTLLKQTARDLTGNWGFDEVRPPHDGEALPSKGNFASDGKWLSGGLDVNRLVAAPLPDIADDRKASEAVKQHF